MLKINRTLSSVSKAHQNLEQLEFLIENTMSGKCVDCDYWSLGCKPYYKGNKLQSRATLTTTSDERKSGHTNIEWTGSSHFKTIIAQTALFLSLG